MLGFLIMIILAVLTVLGIAVSLMAYWVRGAELSSDRTPWQRREHAVSRVEFDLLGKLAPAARDAGVDDRPLVLVRPFLSDVLWLPKGARRARFWEGHARGLRVEFVVCRGSDARPLLAIRLEGLENARTKPEREAALRQILRGAGLLLLTLEPGYTGDVADLTVRIREAIAQAAGPTIVEPAPPPAPAAAPAPMTPARA